MLVGRHYSHKHEYGVECWMFLWNGVLESYTLYTYFCFIFLLYSLSSLNWTGYQWTKLGDEGATALADLRVIKKFKTLK